MAPSWDSVSIEPRRSEMRIRKKTQAGTMQSSDLIVFV
jgi:hypothetical protein